LFATDYPFAQAQPGAACEFLKAAQLSDVDRAKIASTNWQTLRGKIRR